MMRWVLGIMVALCAGLGAFHLFKRDTGPCTDCVRDRPVEPTAQVPALTEPPATLARIVDVTDLSALLDPTEKPQTGVPFENEPAPPITASSTPAPPARIPPASEDLATSGDSR